MEHRLVFSQDLENKFISSSADSKMPGTALELQTIWI